MTGRLIKIYLNRSIEILYFLPVGDYQNVSENLQIFLYFQQYATCKLSCVYNKGFSYMLFLFVLLLHSLNYVLSTLPLLPPFILNRINKEDSHEKSSDQESSEIKYKKSLCNAYVNHYINHYFMTLFD